MSDELERRLREARDGLHRISDERLSQIETGILEDMPQPVRDGRHGRGRSLRRWYALGLALVLVVGATAVATGRLGGLFTGEPPPEVARAFLLSGGEEAPTSPRGTTSTRRPPSTVAARLVAADTPWGRYTYWRGLDATGQVIDLVQDPTGAFGGGSPCLAFDPVIPMTDRARVPVPDVIGLGPSAARAKLEAAGFSVKIAPDGGRDTFVLGTRPGPGSPAYVGASVEAYLGPPRFVRPAERDRRPSQSGAIVLCGAGTTAPNVTPTVLQGAVSADVATAEIAYADGRRMPAFISNRSILVVVPPQTCDYGLEPPQTLHLRDRDGEEVDSVALGERGFDLAGWEANGPPQCGPPPTPPAGGAASLFSVLERPITGDDALPEAIRSSGPQNLRPRSARLAATVGGWRFYAVTARPYPAAPETVCLVDVRSDAEIRVRRGPGFTYGPGGPAGSACPLAAIFDTSFHISVLRISPKGTATIAGLIPDGFTQVAGGGRKADVVGNVYLLKDVPIGATLTATGPGGTRTALVGGRTGQLPSPERRVF